MNLFKQFQTDTNLEKAGIILNYGQNDKGQNIDIKIARAGGGNHQFRKQIEHATKPVRRLIQNELLGDEKQLDLMREVYAKSVVLGWSGVEDENGEPIAFSVENCIDLFKRLPDLFTDIQEQATKAALFRAADLEEDAKN